MMSARERDIINTITIILPARIGLEDESTAAPLDLGYLCSASSSIAGSESESATSEGVI